MGKSLIIGFLGWCITESFPCHSAHKDVNKLYTILSPKTSASNENASLISKQHSLLRKGLAMALWNVDVLVLFELSTLLQNLLGCSQKFMFFLQASVNYNHIYLIRDEKNTAA
jgi:hypothetical protein